MQEKTVKLLGPFGPVIPTGEDPMPSSIPGFSTANNPHKVAQNIIHHGDYTMLANPYAFMQTEGTTLLLPGKIDLESHAPSGRGEDFNLWDIPESTNVFNDLNTMLSDPAMFQKAAVAGAAKGLPELNWHSLIPDFKKWGDMPASLKNTAILGDILLNLVGLGKASAAFMLSRGGLQNFGFGGGTFTILPQIKGQKLESSSEWDDALARMVSGELDETNLDYSPTPENIQRAKSILKLRPVTPTGMTRFEAMQSLAKRYGVVETPQQREYLNIAQAWAEQVLAQDPDYSGYSWIGQKWEELSGEVLSGLYASELGEWIEDSAVYVASITAASKIGGIAGLSLHRLTGIGNKLVATPLGRAGITMARNIFMYTTGTALFGKYLKGEVTKEDLLLGGGLGGIVGFSEVGQRLARNFIQNAIKKSWNATPPTSLTPSNNTFSDSTKSGPAAPKQSAEDSYLNSPIVKTKTPPTPEKTPPPPEKIVQVPKFEGEEVAPAPTPTAPAPAAAEETLILGSPTIKVTPRVKEALEMKLDLPNVAEASPPLVEPMDPIDIVSTLYFVPKKTGPFVYPVFFASKEVADLYNLESKIYPTATDLTDILHNANWMAAHNELRKIAPTTIFMRLDNMRIKSGMFIENEKQQLMLPDANVSIHENTISRLKETQKIANALEKALLELSQFYVSKIKTPVNILTTDVERTDAAKFIEMLDSVKNQILSLQIWDITNLPLGDEIMLFLEDLDTMRRLSRTAYKERLASELGSIREEVTDSSIDSFQNEAAIRMAIADFKSGFQGFSFDIFSGNYYVNFNELNGQFEFMAPHKFLFYTSDQLGNAYAQYVDAMMTMLPAEEKIDYVIRAVADSHHYKMSNLQDFVGRLWFNISDNDREFFNKWAQNDEVNRVFYQTVFDFGKKVVDVNPKKIKTTTRLFAKSTAEKLTPIVNQFAKNYLAAVGRSAEAMRELGLVQQEIRSQGYIAQNYDAVTLQAAGRDFVVNLWVEKANAEKTGKIWGYNWPAFAEMTPQQKSLFKAHLADIYDDIIANADGTALNVPAKIETILSKRRAIFYNSFDDFMSILGTLGSSKTVIQTAIDTLKKQAHLQAKIKILGPNPGKVAKIIETSLKKIPDTETGPFVSLRKSLALNGLKNMTDSFGIPTEPHAVFKTLNSLNSMEVSYVLRKVAKWGLAYDPIVSALMTQELGLTPQKPFVYTMLDGLKNIIPVWKQAIAAATKNNVITDITSDIKELSYIGLLFDGMTRMTTELDYSPAASTYPWAQAFGLKMSKWTGADAMQRISQSNMGLVFQRKLHDLIKENVKWIDLDPRLQGIFKRAGMSADEWNGLTLEDGLVNYTLAPDKFTKQWPVDLFSPKQMIDKYMLAPQSAKSVFSRAIGRKLSAAQAIIVYEGVVNGNPAITKMFTSWIKPSVGGTLGALVELATSGVFLFKGYPMNIRRISRELSLGRGPGAREMPESKKFVRSIKYRRAAAMLFAAAVMLILYDLVSGKTPKLDGKFLVNVIGNAFSYGSMFAGTGEELLKQEAKGSVSSTPEAIISSTMKSMTPPIAASVLNQFNTIRRLYDDGKMDTAAKLMHYSRRNNPFNNMGPLDFLTNRMVLDRLFWAIDSTSAMDEFKKDMFEAALRGREYQKWFLPGASTDFSEYVEDAYKHEKTMAEMSIKRRERSQERRKARKG